MPEEKWDEATLERFPSLRGVTLYKESKEELEARQSKETLEVDSNPMTDISVPATGNSFSAEIRMESRSRDLYEKRTVLAREFFWTLIKDNESDIHPLKDAWVTSFPECPDPSLEQLKSLLMLLPFQMVSSSIEIGMDDMSLHNSIVNYTFEHVDSIRMLLQHQCDALSARVGR